MRFEVSIPWRVPGVRDRPDLVGNYDQVNPRQLKRDYEIKDIVSKLEAILAPSIRQISVLMGLISIN